PIVSSVQMLRWLDARNNSSFGSLAWNGNTLTFSISQDSAAVGLQAMLPYQAGSAVITSITRNGTSVNFTLQAIKGIQYAVFPGASGAYIATYAVDTGAPTVTTTSPTS